MDTIYIPNVQLPKKITNEEGLLGVTIMENNIIVTNKHWLIKIKKDESVKNDLGTYHYYKKNKFQTYQPGKNGTHIVLDKITQDRVDLSLRLKELCLGCPSIGYFSNDIYTYQKVISRQVELNLGLKLVDCEMFNQIMKLFGTAEIIQSDTMLIFRNEETEMEAFLICLKPRDYK